MFFANYRPVDLAAVAAAVAAAAAALAIGTANAATAGSASATTADTYGVNCSTGNDCGAGLICDVYAEWPSCQVALGQPCSSKRVCATSLPCNTTAKSSGKPVCTNSFFSNSTKWWEMQPATTSDKYGVACQQDSDCDSGLACDSKLNQCLLAYAQPCNTTTGSRQCVTGMGCDKSNNPFAPAVPHCSQQYGDQCSGEFCSFGYQCDGGTCKLGPGSVCGTSNQITCASGLQCLASSKHGKFPSRCSMADGSSCDPLIAICSCGHTNGMYVCVKSGQGGQPCTQDKQCLSGTCHQGTCTSAT